MKYPFNQMVAAVSLVCCITLIHAVFQCSDINTQAILALIAIGFSLMFVNCLVFVINAEALR